jgi:hypothetical protein
MNTHTDHAIAKLQQLIPVAASIYVPKIEYAIAALLAGVEREQVQQQRISMLEAKLKEAVEWSEIVENHYVDLCILVDPPIGNEDEPARQVKILEGMGGSE